eukprot:5158205-Amphidinium_carterae.1
MHAKQNVVMFVCHLLQVVKQCAEFARDDEPFLPRQQLTHLTLFVRQTLKHKVWAIHFSIHWAAKIKETIRQSVCTSCG